MSDGKRRLCPLCRAEIPKERPHLVFHYECWGELPAELRKEWNAAKRGGDLTLKRACMRRLLYAAIDLRTNEKE